MHLLGAGLLGRAEADGGLGGDQGRLVGRGLGREQGLFEGVLVVAIHFDGVPADGLEAGDLVGAVGVGDLAVDGDVVVVPDDDELVELEVPGQRDGFLGDAFHQAPVTGQHIGVVVDDVGAELGGELGFGDGKADRIGQALAERTRGGLDTGGMAVFGVAGGLGPDLAEVLHFVDRHVGIAEQVERGIEQHRAVAGREDEAVAIGPVGVRGSNFITLVKSTVAMSAQPMGRPGWPELAFSTASIDSDRIALANSFCWAVFVIAPTALLKAQEKGSKRPVRPPPRGGLRHNRFVPPVNDGRGRIGSVRRGFPGGWAVAAVALRGGLGQARFAGIGAP